MVAQIDKEMYKKYPLKVIGRLFSWAFIEGRPLTTKGQWINPLVFLGYKISQIFPKRQNSDRPIYIIGTGRSGTTVLGTLFSMHKQAVFLNEPKAAWHYIHGSEDLIGSYSNQDATVRLTTVPSSSMARKLSKIYSTAMRFGLAQRVVDKYPELVFRVGFVTELFPQCKFIAILRDGVDTCSSVTNWSQRKGEMQNNEAHDWWGRNGRKWRLLVEQIVPEHDDLSPLQNKLRTTDDHRDRAAVEWIISMREAKKVSAEYSNVLAIKYEDLCSKPDEVLAQIITHCELDEDPKFNNYANTVLNEVEAYKPIELMPELVEPFCDVLTVMGYSNSCSRVIARAENA